MSQLLRCVTSTSQSSVSVLSLFGGTIRCSCCLNGVTSLLGCENTSCRKQTKPLLVLEGLTHPLLPAAACSSGSLFICPEARGSYLPSALSCFGKVLHALLTHVLWMSAAGASAAEELRAREQHKGQPAVQHPLHRQPQRVHQRGRAARPVCRAAGLPPAQACARRALRDLLRGVLRCCLSHERASEPAGAAPTDALHQQARALFQECCHAMNLPAKMVPGVF